jgi:plastocyanin
VTGGSGATPPASQTPSSGTGSSPSGVSPAGGTSAGEAPVTPVAPARVQVTAEDSEGFRFVLSRPTVPAGKVIIEFVNHGQDEHNLNAVEPTEGSVVGSLPNTAPNAHPSLTVNLRPGSYTLFCSLPGHEAKGMKATLVVK